MQQREAHVSKQLQGCASTSYFNPLVPQVWNINTFAIFLRKDHGKNFLWAPRLWVSILGYIWILDLKKAPGSNGLRVSALPVEGPQLPREPVQAVREALPRAGVAPHHVPRPPRAQLACPQGQGQVRWGETPRHVLGGGGHGMSGGHSISGGNTW